MRFKKAIIIHQGALGDLINTLPAINALRSHSDEITAIGSSQLKLLEYAGLIDRFLSPQALGFHHLFMENFQPPPQLKQTLKNADVIISWLGRSSETYERNLKTFAQKVVIFKAHFPPEDEHSTKVLALPVIELGVEINDYLPRLDLSHIFKSAPSLGEEGKFIVFHSGSGSEKKRLPAQKVIKIIKGICDSFSQYLLFLIFGEAEKSFMVEVLKNLHKQTRHQIKILENLDLLQLAQVVSRAELYIGMDSGPTHLASALGTKTLAIFTCSNPKVWAPPQPWAKVIFSNYSCAPCSDEKRRECENPYCGWAIKEEEVLAEIKKLI